MEFNSGTCGSMRKFCVFQPKLLDKLFSILCLRKKEPIFHLFNLKIKENFNSPTKLISNSFYIVTTNS